ncbi:MAG TPA: hypothetical protein VN461_21935 [Vicinamibacteria bacterium]|jgi:hypothetical protein|nr:hypothetical protein [Vicinamibacteria bacterium]
MHPAPGKTLPDSRRPPRPALAAFAFLAAAAAAAQEPAPAPAPTDLTGNWTGTGTFTNEWPSSACAYDGTAGTAVTLELSRDAGKVSGSLAIDVPSTPGSGCPALRKRYQIPEAQVSQDAVTFTDSGGHEWNLGLRKQFLKGLVVWKEGAGGEPLAEGFALPSGVRPLTRLSGEVKLERVAEPAPAEAHPGAAGKAKKGGNLVRNLGIVLGANVVALGVLVGVNKVAKTSSTSATITCSPRTCLPGEPGQQCLCNANVLSGNPCGTTTSGVPLAGVCDGNALPCQSGFSCNAGVCEDRNGRCPY